MSDTVWSRLSGLRAAASTLPARDVALALTLAWLLSGPMLTPSPAANHDVAAIGTVAEQMLHGDRLYVDLPQPNPPLAFLATIPPLLLARAAGWDALVTIQASLMLLFGISMALFAAAAKACGVPAQPGARTLLVLLATALTFGYENYHLGQRDGAMLVLVLPYLLGALGAAEGRPLGGRLAVLVGLAAGLGVALKPQFLLLPMAVEVVVAAQARSLAPLVRRDLLVLLGVFFGFYLWVVAGTGYVANVLEWKDGYRRYGSLGGSFEKVLARTRPTVLLWAVPLLAFRPAAHDDPDLRRFGQILLAGLGAAVASVIAQGKGFTYHIWPIEVLGWLFVGTSALRWWSSRAGRVAATLVLAGLVWHVGVSENDARGLMRPGVDRDRIWECPARPGLGMGRKGICKTPELIEAVRRRTRPGDRIATLTTTVFPFGWVPVGAGVVESVSISPLLLGDLYAGTPTDVDPVPYHTGEARTELERRLIEGFHDDLVRHEPKLILVDHRPWMQGLGATRFDLLEYYRQDPRTAAILDEHYREVRVPEANGALRVLQRKRPPTRSGSGLPFGLPPLQRPGAGGTAPPAPTP